MLLKTIAKKVDNLIEGNIGGDVVGMQQIHGEGKRAAYEEYLPKRKLHFGYKGAGKPVRDHLAAKEAEK